MDNVLALFADINDALTAAVHALGGFKKVGVMLRPELQTRPQSASQWLRDCLNEEKREHLNPPQVFLLLREARGVGFHASKHWIDDELGYERGGPVSEQDEMARLVHMESDLVSQFKVLLDRRERLAERVKFPYVINGSSSNSNR